MSYIDIKLIKGHLYGYVRQSIRIGKRVIHKNIAYLGAMSPVHRARQEPITFEPVSEREPEREPIYKPIKAPVERVKKGRKVRVPEFKIDVGKGSKLGAERIQEESMIIKKKKITRKKKIKKESENLFRIG